MSCGTKEGRYLPEKIVDSGCLVIDDSGKQKETKTKTQTQTKTKTKKLDPNQRLTLSFAKK